LRQTLIALVAAIVCTAPLAAHDFWLAAENWSPAPGAPVTVTAGIGELFPTRTTFRTRDNWLADWRVIDASGDAGIKSNFRTKDLVMATDVTLPASGAYLGVAVVSAQTIEMKGPEFTDYLKEEGLDQIVEARRAAGETDKTTKERYARYAKIALRTGGGSGAHLSRPVGLKAEFVPATDPTAVRAGDPITVQLLADGKPVANATVAAVTAGAGGIQKATTDASGRATFKVDREGAWLIKTIHMVRLAPSTDVEWESYWVTLAFHAASR